jgi:hypothetical protein
METERIALNQRERDRLRVLHEIQRKHISQIECGPASEDQRAAHSSVAGWSQEVR